MSNQQPIDPPGPLTEPVDTVKTYTATTLPENWKALGKDQKISWLDTQPLTIDKNEVVLPTRRKSSLGGLYRCGYNLNVHFHFLYDVLKDFRESFSTLSRDNVCRKLLIALIDAFNAGLVSFGHALWTEIEHLLEDGTWGNQLPMLEVDFFEDIKGSTGDTITEDTIAEGASNSFVPLWDMISRELKILQTHDLHSISPSLASGPYADLLLTAKSAGDRFRIVWNNAKNKKLDISTMVETDSHRHLEQAGAVSVSVFFDRVAGKRGYASGNLKQIPEVLEPPRALSVM